jgi:tetratricopeptide (TPR) repeat protein
MKFRPVYGGVVVALAVQGCGLFATAPAQAPKSRPSTPASRELRADDFGTTLSSTLRAPRRRGQSVTELTGLVRLQLARATKLFALGEDAAGLAAVRGALFLVKAGEATAQMWQGAEVALSLAAEEASRVGDEGQARALYSLVKQANPTKSLAQSTDEHLAAMDQFSRASETTRSLEQMGDAQRVTIDRSLYEPTPENLEAAARQIIRWINGALTSDVLDRWSDGNSERQEAIEAYRARRFGAVTLVAAYLRHGDSMGAIDWLEKNDLGRLLPPELRSRLEQAGEDDDPTAWGELYQFFKAESDPSRADSTIGVELAEAAAFGLAVELYRSKPTSLMTAGPLALMLPDYQLGDAVPPMLQGALGEHPGREEVNWAMALLMRAVLSSGEVGDIEATRHTFQLAEPILKQVQARTVRGETFTPHPARLYRVMATFESRFAELERAKTMLMQAVELEPGTLGFIELARIERQRGDTVSALSFIDKAIVYAKTVDDALGATEALTVRFELLSAQGDGLGADRVLREALNRAMGARDTAQRPVELAQAERRYARILEHYGQKDGALRALRRALLVAHSDAQQRSVTILDMARLALVDNDLDAARRALRDAQEYGLRGEDCTYVALWFRLLERRRHLPSDGTVEELLARSGELSYWAGKLKAWILGQLSDAELVKSARREPERVEADFYRAMNAEWETSSAEWLKVIQRVARSRAVGLVEVSIAQDLTLRGSQYVPPAWPSGLTIP